MKHLTAIYARYSSEQQRATSIEDQIRRCAELAERHELEISHELIFSDAALSGTAKDLDKREGYQALLAAWDSGLFSVLLVDDISRIARDVLELALLQKRLETTRVRLITADGLDTAQQNWELLFGMQSIVSQQAVRDTQHRVVRGMLGQLERGYMVAYPPFGYELDRKLTAEGERVGTHWRINPEDAAIVKEIYESRRNGTSLHEIARRLNEREISPPRKPRKTVGYWRPGMLSKLLCNPIYRGEFVWNDSAFVRAKAKKTGRKLSVQYFSRPQLRIVDDELWYACKNKSYSRNGRGGGRTPFSGLIECGACGAMLAVGAGKVRSLYCAECSQATRISAPDCVRYTGSIASSGIKQMLLSALRELMSPTVVAEFRYRLQKRLMAGVTGELLQARQLYDLARQSIERLARFLASLNTDDPILETEYRKKQAEYRRLEEKVRELESKQEIFHKAAMEKQLHAEPKLLLDGLFDESQPAGQVRAVLARLFPKIIFLGKTSRTTAVFELTYSPGAAAALASNTVVVDDHAVVKRVELSSSAKRPTVWTMSWS